MMFNHANEVRIASGALETDLSSKLCQFVYVFVCTAK